MVAAMRKAARPHGVWLPGGRIWDDSVRKLDVDLLRRLLESEELLPEEERWTPTRWLMKAVWEVVHGSNSPLGSLISGPRSTWDNNVYVLDLYRKLTADFNSSPEEVTGTGERAHTRCSRSYVFSAQLRHWLHEIPVFVSLPPGWEPPPTAISPTPPAPVPVARAASIGAARRPGMHPPDAPYTPMGGGGFRGCGHESETSSYGRPLPATDYDAPTGFAGGGGSPPSERVDPRLYKREDPSHAAPNYGSRADQSHPAPPSCRQATPPRWRPPERERPPATVPSVRMAASGRRGASPRRRGSGLYTDGRGLTLISELAARLRQV